MAVSARGRRSGRRGSGTGNEFNGRQKRCRVRLGSLGHRPDNPRVTALLFGLAQQTAAPPHSRMPPVKSANDQLEPAHPMIATFQMGELVQQERCSLVDARFRPKLSRHEQPRSAANRPEHGRYSPGHEAKARSLGEPQPSRQLGSTGLPLFRGWVNFLHQSLKSHDSQKGEKPPPDCTREHDAQHQILPASALR